MSQQAFAWLLLSASVIAEVAGTVALRHADGFTRLVPSLLVGACYAGAIWLMAIAVRHLEIPYGYFERRVALPAVALEAVSQELNHGCLVVRLRKVRQA